MNELSVNQSDGKRRRHSPQFKQKVVEACLSKQSSIPKIALAHGLNANMVHRWIRKAQDNKVPVASGFVALPIQRKTALQPAPSQGHGGHTERIDVEIPFHNQCIKISWPVSQTDRCLALLRELLR
ncbi:MAG: transposase [Gammaproteobacteria bacterium]|nr:transposase [Gammaproteobacteria bacterium]